MLRANNKGACLVLLQIQSVFSQLQPLDLPLPPPPPLPTKMKKGASSSVHTANTNEDDKELEALGYVPSFKREFSNLATVSNMLPIARLVLN